MGRSKLKAIVYLIISAVVIILIKLWLHYTSWQPIATIRAEEQARAVCKEYVLTCESVEINELIRGEPYAYLTVKVSDAEKLDKETLFECVRKLNHITCGKLHKNIQCLSPAKKYKLYKSSINKSIHFVQRSLSSSTRVQRVTAQRNLSRE